MTISLFNPHLPNRSNKILDPSSGVLNWDDIKNKAYLNLWEQMQENFWVAKEVSMSQDEQQWHSIMSDHEKRTYRLAIGQLAVLDSIATKYDLLLSKTIQDSTIAAAYGFVSAMESIHNFSYTYCLSSFTNSKEIFEIFEAPKHIDVMIERNKIVVDVFNEFVNNPTKENVLKSVVANMILEGVFFTSGFTYFYHLSRNGKMSGTQSMISLIQRDEKAHGILNSYMIRDLITDYPELNTLEFNEWLVDIFKRAVEAEKRWCDYLYEGVSGISMTEMYGYIEYIASYSLDLLGVESPFENKTNPMRWIVVYDPQQMNKTKTDFFEARETNYSKTTDEKNGWDEL